MMTASEKDAHRDRGSPRGRRLDLFLLEEFVALCDAGTISKAAERLRTSTQDLLRDIARIEENFGLQLVIRRGDDVRPTPAGSELWHRGRGVLGEVEDTLEALDAFHANRIPRVNLLIQETASHYLASAVIPYLERNVGEIKVMIGRTGTQVEDLLRGALDMVISTDDLGEIGDIERFPIATEQLVALLPATIAPEDRNLPFLSENFPFLFFRDRGWPAAADAFMKRLTRQPVRSIECASASPMVELIEAGFGWTVTTPITVASLKPDARRVVWLPLNTDLRTTLAVLSWRNRLADVPERVAALCRTAIADQVALWRTTLGDVAADAISVQGSRVLRTDAKSQPVRKGA